MNSNPRRSEKEYTADQRDGISYGPSDGQNRSWATYGVHLRHSVSAQRGNYYQSLARGQWQNPRSGWLIDQLINRGEPSMQNEPRNGLVGCSYDLWDLPQNSHGTQPGQNVSVKRSNGTGMNSEEYNTFRDRCKEFLHHTITCSRMIPSWTREAIKNKYATAMDQVDVYDVERTDELVKQAKDEIKTLLVEYMRNDGEVISARTYAIQAGQAWSRSVGRDNQIVPSDEDLWRYADTEREPTFL